MSIRGDRGVYARDEVTPYLKGSVEVKETFLFTSQLIEESQQPRESFLDVGCASGDLTSHLVEQFPNSNHVGIDVTPEFISIAAKRDMGKKATFQVMDFLDYEGSFDCVTCIGTLSMFEDPLKSLEKLISLTSPGGLLIVEGLFNEPGWDVRVEYRRHTEEGVTAWHSGLDSCSMVAASALIQGLGLPHRYVNMPFNHDLPRRADMSTPRWFTSQNDIGERIHMNDLGMYMTHKFLVVEIPAKN
jgi:SAM-dependent methyltransferase